MPTIAAAFYIWGCSSFLLADNPRFCLSSSSNVLVIACRGSPRQIYSGSQKYLPTFEPTLHQDFWLCLC